MVTRTTHPTPPLTQLELEIVETIAKKYNLHLSIASSNESASLTLDKKKMTLFANWRGINSLEAEKACKDPKTTYKILSKNVVAALEPGTNYREVQHNENGPQEFQYIYKIVMLAHESLLVLRKKRLFLLGDYTSTVEQLYASWKNLNPTLAPLIKPPTENKTLGWKEDVELEFISDDWNGHSADVMPNRKIPPGAQMFHCDGFEVEPDLTTTIINIGEIATKVLGINFAVVDIVVMTQIYSIKNHAVTIVKVLKVDPEVPIADFVASGLLSLEKATEIYEKIICKTLNISSKEESKEPPALKIVIES